MAKQVADVQIHAQDSQDIEEDSFDISVDLIDERLYLGNLACARDQKTLKELKITHVLTIDLVPLPRTILERMNLHFKFLKLADVPKEDLISNLPTTNEFIKKAISEGGTVLVHWHKHMLTKIFPEGVVRDILNPQNIHVSLSNESLSSVTGNEPVATNNGHYFGVSRSAAIVIGYIMEKYCLCYEDAFTLVRTNRRFVHPNIGFEAQLKLFGHMGYVLNRDDPRFKQFRLKMAGQKLKQVKILPQLFADLVKPDPGLIRERPDPIVYRCKKCRRIVASQNNIIPHIPKQLKIELAKKGIRPPPSGLTSLHCSENGQLLLDKLKSLACQIMDREDTGSDEHSREHSDRDTDDGPSQQVDGYSEGNMVDANIAGRDAVGVCRLMWFVEPMAWMSDVTHAPQGKLHCPKCTNKIGSFSWVMGCKCPCGQKVAPAFYLVPSKVEWSNIVQNVQVTV